MLVKQSLISNFTNSSLQFLSLEYKSKSLKNITIGIRYFCTSYINATYCNPLPIQISSLLSSLLTSYPINQLISLDNALAALLYKTAAGCLIISTILAFFLWCILALLLSISQCGINL